MSEEETRTLSEAIHLLALSAGHNENLLLRVTPNNVGAIPKRQMDVLKGIGKWLKRYSKSIMDTVNGPYTAGAWGVSTRMDNNIYLHILQHSKDGIYRLEALPDGIKKMKLLNTGKAINYTNRDGELTIYIPPEISSSRKEADIVVQVIYPKDINTTEFDSLYKNRWRESLAVDATITATQTSKLRNRDSSVDIFNSKAYR